MAFTLLPQRMLLYHPPKNQNEGRTEKQAQKQVLQSHLHHHLSWSAVLALSCLWAKKPFRMSSPKLPILLSLNQLSPWDRQKLYLDTHFHKPSLSLLCSDSVGTSLSHIENAPSHICQEGSNFYFRSLWEIPPPWKMWPRLEFAELGNVQMERRWQNPLCST